MFRTSCISIVIAVSLFSSYNALAEANGWEIDRTQNSLSLSWQGSEASSWVLKDENNRVCASGQLSKGQNKIVIPKISDGSPLFLLEGTGRHKNSLRIDGRNRLSTLPKLGRAAVVYELEPRTFLARDMGEGNTGKLSYLTSERISQIQNLGVDYIWLAGVLEHANPKTVDPDGVKGEAGSYYAIYDSWDVSSQIGNLDEFNALVERAHRLGMRILIDLIPNHTGRVHKTDVACKDTVDFGKADQTDLNFSPGNNYYYLGKGSIFVPPRNPNQIGSDGNFDIDLTASGIQPESPAKVTGNNIFSPSPDINDWYETVKLNYGIDIFNHKASPPLRSRTWEQVVDVATYWLRKGVDGFRVDVAHAVPLEFWRYFVQEIRKVQPNAFLLAEAYEEDPIMAPGFSYEGILAAGFDSVLNGRMYWNLRRQATQSQDMDSGTYTSSPGVRDLVLRNGYLFTQFMGNHDEVRLASRHFAPSLSERSERAELGYAYSVYSALLPGNFLVHSGDEFQEDAGVVGSFAGDNGRTSIFDFVYQAQSRAWLSGKAPDWMLKFREQYRKLLSLKHRVPFILSHSYDQSTFIDLVSINGWKEESKWVSAYVRFRGEDAYLIVINADPTNGRVATIHFTSSDNADPSGALRALKIENTDQRYLFVEALTREGWVPKDPAVSGSGLPGWALYRSGNVPSGLYLGEIPPRTTYVFKVKAQSRAR